MKATVIANSNTALIKYFGKKDEKLILPMNNSISVTTDALSTITTVEFSKDYTKDIFFLNGKEQAGKPYSRVTKHLDLIRSIAKNDLAAKVYSENNFPTAAGLASSASGFAALTAAACKALSLELSNKELSIISRKGSGSSCRSFHGGYVEWLKGTNDSDSFSVQLAEKDWLEIRDIVVVLPAPERKTSTREAMRLAMRTSPFYQARLEATEKNLVEMREAIQNKDFTTIGKITERDCLSMHCIAMTSEPSQLFWIADTVTVIHAVEKMREEGIEAYYTIDTGANMHVLTLPEFEKAVLNALKEIPSIVNVIVSKPGDGVRESTEHLF